MNRRILRAVRAMLVLGLAVGPFAVSEALAQGPTPEGTVITNIAVVNWTDANGNSYTPDSASVSVTVGFSAGIDVIAAAATVTPASPSTADTLAFQVANIGNGTDSVTISENISVAGIITVTGYRYAATTYATLVALNSALAGSAMAQNDTITIQVIYDVGAGQGGQSTVYTMTATSRRDASTSDFDATTITPAETIAVAVTPDGGQNLQQLPSNGTNYTFTFTVTNNGNGPEDFDLLASNPGTAISIVSVNGVAGDSTRISGLAASASQNIDVIYSIGNVPAGTVDTLFLRARSVTQPATFDDGSADLTVVRPSVTIAKVAYRDNQVTLIGAGTVVPGEFIQYRITVTNSGDAAASSVVVTDALPAEVTYVSNSDPGGSWASITESGGTVTANLNGTLAAGGGSAYFWIRVQVK